jgi:hypothetical protein
MRQFLIPLILTGAILMSACGNTAPSLDLSKESVRQTLTGQLKQVVFNTQWAEYNCADSGYYHPGLETSGLSFKSFQCPDEIKNRPAEAIKIRNKVLDGGLGLIDDAYGVYTRDIRKQRTVQEFLSDLAEIGASTAIGITNGQRAIQIIGIALTGFRAGRKSAQLNFYDAQTTSVLIKQMDASRSRVLGEIHQKEAQATSDYSFDAALNDILRYFDVGTLNRAFTEMDKQTTIEGEIARLGVLKIQGIADVSSVPTVQQAQVITGFVTGMKKLEGDLKNPDRQQMAAAALKTIYEKLAARTEFAPILTNLKSIANGTTTDDTMTPNNIAILKSAFTKLSGTTATPTGDEYRVLVESIFNKTEGNAALQQTMLDTLNSVTK